MTDKFLKSEDPIKGKIMPKNNQDEIASYESAVQLSISNAQGVWEIHNSMLLVNSILIGLVMLIIDRPVYGHVLGIIFPCLGVIINFVWLCLVIRARRYADYFVLSAREIENRSFAEPSQLLTRGARFASGESVSFSFGDSTRSIKMGRLAKLGRVITSSLILVCSFGVIYIIILVFAITLLFTPK